MPEIDLEDAVTPLVMAVDIGSSSVRALLYDTAGRVVTGTEHQIRHALETSPDGGSTADPDHLVSLVHSCIDHALANTGIRRGDIRAVGLTSFWHSLMGLDEDREPATHVLMWADKRSGDDALALERALDADRIHTETGCRLHSSYWPAKLRWLRRTDPDAYASTKTWVSFVDYLSWTIHHELSTSISMASGTGLLHSSGAHWHDELLTVLEITIEQLPKLTDRDVAFPPPIEEFRVRWPDLANAAWHPAIGDGAAANVGAGCVGADRIALTIGTSGAMRVIIGDETDHEPVSQPLSPKLWQYRLDRRHRVAGGALSNGGNITYWLADLTQDHDFDALTEAASAIEADGHGLTVLPFFAGERSPSWNDQLTGTISGLSLGTTAGELFRAFLEATAYRFASIYEDLRALALADHDIHANGGAALRSPLWLQILSDSLNHQIHALDAEAEASARGAAISALESIRAIDSLLEPETTIVRSYEPDENRHAIYVAGRQRLERYERALVKLGSTGVV
ncbi:MAG TPA: gluconokinase [Thermomicrobiales bacterium]|nr:gluconokinase [Thermomicrobiales bacterium]